MHEERTLGRLRYFEASHAPSFGQRRGTLVLVHAFPLNARMWDPQFTLADAGWRVLAPQLRGFGDGQADGRAQSMDDYAGDIIDLLDGLHVEEAVIGGLSMGGYVAFAIFRHAPRYVRALVLADTRSEADTVDGIALRREMLHLVSEKGSSAVADVMIPKLLGRTTRADRPDVVDRVRSLIESNSTEAISGALQALMTRPDSTPLLREIRCPTLVLVGEEDVVTPRQASEQLQSAIPGAEFIVIPDAGHLSSLEQPEAFNAAVARFVTYRV
jgi:pimeloyl-ACP methyl ester carboxylesterase